MLSSYKNIAVALIDFSTRSILFRNLSANMQAAERAASLFFSELVWNFSFQLHNGFMPCEKAVISSVVFLQAHFSLTEPYINII